MAARLIATGRGTQTALRQLQASGQATRLRRGLYLLPGKKPGGHLLGTIGAAVARLEAVASHETAAALWGIPVLGRHPIGVQVTRARRAQGTARYDGVMVHHAGLDPAHVTIHKGIAVTTPARTVIDLARGRSFRAGVVAADASLRLRQCTQDELDEVIQACRRWPGLRRARKVAAFADPAAESPLESISRVAFHHYGVPTPLLQAIIGGCERADFLWPQFQVIGEADGMNKYTTPEVLRREKLREEGFAQLGFTVFRWTWIDAHRRPDALAHRALTVLVRRGYRP